MQQAVEHPEIISLAAGLVDDATLPVEETREAVEALLTRDGRGALQYGTTLGYRRLRELVLERFCALEGTTAQRLRLGLDQVILTTGSQQFLALASETLLDPGDIVLMSAPSYFVYMGTLANLGVRAIGVSMDDGGMRLDALEERLAELEQRGELERVKLIYVVSYFQSLAEERRPELVEIARRWSRHGRIFVLEDAAYRELRYAGADVHSVRYYDERGDTVIHCQTFSKVYSPGLRTGFSFVPHELMGPVCDLKGNQDFGSANFNQHLLATVMERGLYERHAELLVAAYRRKAAAMVEAADQGFGHLPGVRWVRPQGGLYVWMSLPEEVDTGRGGELFHRAVAEGVMYVPGEFCYPPEPKPTPQDSMRLSFGVQSEAGIREGMARLARALEGVLSSASAGASE
jgi:2-aminoadipate transaminase